MKKKQEKRYEFAVPRLYSITAEDAAKELERIKTKYGKLDPADVVEESKDTSSVLHSVFCWDDDEAAKRYRERQAQDLIRNIKVTIVNKTVNATVRAFVNVRTTTLPQRSYVSLYDAIKDDVAYADLLNQAKQEMASFVAKYSQIDELSGVRVAMLQVLNL